MKYVWQKPNWPNFKWQHEPLLAPLGKVRLAQGKLIHQAQTLGFDLSREAEAKIVLEETLKTAAIEGEKLNPLAVRSSIAKRLGLPTAGLPAVERHVDGLVEVLLDATTNYKKLLTLARIKAWHAALFPTGYSGMTKIATAQWRQQDPMQIVSGRIGHEKVHFEAPPAKKVDKEMKQFLSWWQKSLNQPNNDGILRAAIAHFYFVTIHPFEDGNGRLTRALTDMALAQDEKMTTRFYSLSSQIMAERNAYYKILETTSKGDGDITEWLLWFVECLERALHRSEKLIDTVLAKANFWHKYATVNISDRQRKALNRLLDVGEGGFEGGLTTRKYVTLTKTSRATAYREIDDLVKKKMLVANDGSGRNVSYKIGS